MKVLAYGALAYLAVVAIAYFLQHALTYPGDSTRSPPEVAGLVGVRETQFKTRDGALLIVWRAAAKPGQPTLLYFHGNGASLVNRAPRIRRFMAEGWGVVMMAYRGYAGSTGSPSEAANFADGWAVFEALLASGVEARDVFLYGESLGSGVATEVAKRFAQGDAPGDGTGGGVAGLGGVILEAPYTSVPDAGAAQFWFLPVRLLMRERYATIDKIARIKAPLLIVHGARDRTIPIALGEKVFAAAVEPKRMVRYPTAGHNDLFLAPNSAFEAVRAFVGEVRGGRGAAPN